MTQTEQISAAAPAAKINDKFSWRRVWMVARYWWPHLRPVFLIYLGVLVFSGIVAGFVDKENFFSLSFLLAIGTYMSLGMSAQFGTSAGRDLTITLPARNSEKMTFLLLYSILLVPVLALLDDAIYELISERPYYEAALFKIQDVCSQFTPELLFSAKIYNIAATLATVTTCLYFSAISRRGGVMRGIGFAVIVFFIMSFAMGLNAGLIGFVKGYNMAKQGAPELDETEILKYTYRILPTVFYTISALATVWTGIMMYRFVKCFPKRQGI